MGKLARLPYPVIFLVAVEVAERNHRLAVFSTYLIGNLAQPDVVADMIFKFPPCLERYRIDNDVIVNIICV